MVDETNRITLCTKRRYCRWVGKLQVLWLPWLKRAVRPWISWSFSSSWDPMGRIWGPRWCPHGAVGDGSYHPTVRTANNRNGLHGEDEPGMRRMDVPFLAADTSEVSDRQKCVRPTATWFHRGSRYGRTCHYAKRSATKYGFRVQPTSW